MAKITLTGCGNWECKIEVDSFNEFPRGKDGTCALCKGDPCLEDPKSKNKNLKDFWKHNPQAETCPVCLGRPT